MVTQAQTPTPQESFWQRFKRRTHHGDSVFFGVTLIFALFIVAMIILIGIVTFVGSAEARAQFGLGFWVNDAWGYSSDAGVELYGALAPVYGTLTTSLIAVILSAPIGIATGVFLAELCPGALRMPLSLLVELLAAIPSVIYGLWGTFIFIPFFRTFIATPISESLGKVIPQLGGPVTMGHGIMVTGVVLAIMILPTIAAITRDVVSVVPNSQREIMFALGATHWDVIWKAILPYSLPGILGGVMLGLGRALGETMAAVMLIGNTLTIKTSLFSTGTTAAALIANQLPNADSSLHRSSLIYLAMVLFSITLLLNLFARLMVWRISHNR